MEKLKADADSIFKKMTEEEEGPFPDLDRIEKNDTEKTIMGSSQMFQKKIQLRISRKYLPIKNGGRIR